jgi:hypothetical protein
MLQDDNRSDPCDLQNQNPAMAVAGNKWVLTAVAGPCTRPCTAQHLSVHETMMKQPCISTLCEAPMPAGTMLQPAQAASRPPAQVKVQPHEKQQHQVACRSLQTPYAHYRHHADGCTINQLLRQGF